MTNFRNFVASLFATAEAGTRTKSGKKLHHANPSRIPLNVLTGCKQELVVVPGTDHPASTREGKPIFATRKGGPRYRVTDQHGVARKQWKALVNAEKRKAAGRYVGPFGFPSKVVA